MIPWIFRMDVPRGGMQTHQVWTVKKYILGSGHNSLGGPLMLDISPARIGTVKDLSVKFAEMQKTYWATSRRSTILFRQKSSWQSKREHTSRNRMCLSTVMALLPLRRELHKSCFSHGAAAQAANGNEAPSRCATDGGDAAERIRSDARDVLPLAADEEHVSCLTIFTDVSACLDAAWPRRRTAAGWGAVVLHGKPGAEQRLIGVVGGQVILNRDHLHFLGATTRTVSTAEITGIAIPAAYLVDVCCGQEIVFMVDSRHAMGVLSGKMRAIANAELVQKGRALISRLSECTVVQWRHVASHAGNVYNELADRVAALASRGAVVSAIGPLPRRETRDASQVPCPVKDEAEIFLDERHDETSSEVVCV